MATKTKPRTEGTCPGCGRDFTKDSCKSCHRPYDNNEPDPKTVLDLRKKKVELEREISVLTALDPTRGLPRENRELVRTLIGVLRELEEAGDPTPGATPVAQMRVKHADSSVLPGAHTAWARNLTDRIRKALARYFREYEQRKQGVYKPDIKQKVRCVNAHCGAKWKRIPRFIETAGGSVIENVLCTVCGNRLTAAK